MLPPEVILIVVEHLACSMGPFASARPAPFAPLDAFACAVPLSLSLSLTGGGGRRAAYDPLELPDDPENIFGRTRKPWGHPFAWP